MTCIVGIVDDGKVYIGGDSAGVSGYSVTIRGDSKVFVNGDFIMGFTTSFRMGQLLRYSFSPPKRHKDVDLMSFMVTDFVNSVRECLKSGGFASKNSEQEQGGTFIVGHEGKLFMVDGDYQVGLSKDGVFACGCGDEYALGSLYSSCGKNPEERITEALEAASKYSSGVSPPFTIKSL